MRKIIDWLMRPEYGKLEAVLIGIAAMLFMGEYYIASITVVFIAAVISTIYQHNNPQPQDKEK